MQPKFTLQGTVKFIQSDAGPRLKQKTAILGRLRKEESKIRNSSTNPGVKMVDPASNLDKFIDLEGPQDNLDSEILGLKTNPKKSVSGSVYSKQVPRSENNHNVDQGRNNLNSLHFKKTHVKQRGEILNRDFKTRNRTYNCATDNQKNTDKFVQAQDRDSLYGQKSFLSTDKNATYGKLKVKGRDDHLDGLLRRDNDAIGVIKIDD